MYIRWLFELDKHIDVFDITKTHLKECLNDILQTVFASSFENLNEHF